MTKAVEASLPALYSNEDKPAGAAVAVVKFFTPDTDWTWYATEYNPEERTFFGLVDGFVKELGYFNLDELKTLRGPFGLPVERDLYWKPTPLKEVDPKLA